MKREREDKEEISSSSEKKTKQKLVNYWDFLEACKKGELDEIQDILENFEVDLDTTNVLHISASTGNLDVVNMFLEMGADVNAVNLLGKTPFHVAVQSGHLNVAKVLIQNGAM